MKCTQTQNIAPIVAKKSGANIFVDITSHIASNALRTIVVGVKKIARWLLKIAVAGGKTIRKELKKSCTATISNASKGAIQMKIIEPSVELIDEINPEEILCKLERCGKVSRKSKFGNAESFVRSIIKRGHESVLEHVQLTFRIICDRAIMAELTRHRLASFTVESTRYVKYDELRFIKGYAPVWSSYVEGVEAIYKEALKRGEPPEIARSVLPLCLATELYMTANLRELRHILKLRTAKAAHPQMRFVAGQILQIMREKLPVVVEDI